MNQERELIYLAALLHDIGKFYQRADTGMVKDSCFLSDHCKDEAAYCPSFNGRYTHKHALWTAQFIEKYRSTFDALPKVVPWEQAAGNNLMDLAAKHHLPYNLLTNWGCIIKEADNLSAGMDREAIHDQAEKTEWDTFKKKRLIPITATIKCDGKGLDAPEVWSIPVKQLSLKSDSFPQQQLVEAPDYKSLWEGFEKEFQKIKTREYRVMSETLLNLLLKYTTCIPSSTIHFPDVSLYDHLKTTAALAVCLYDTYKDHGDEKEPFIMIGADFSGIQSYIYQVVSKYAGKNLKGRSFYLRLLSDAIVRYLLKELDLFQANVIYNSGGGFYILAPNTKVIKEKLQAATDFIEERLFAIHGDSLYVSIEYVPLSKSTLTHQGDEYLGKIWTALFEKCDKKKNHKFHKLLKTHYASFFEPITLGGDMKMDIVTGEVFAQDEKIYKQEELTPLKQITKEQIQLGKALRNFNVMVVTGQEMPSCRNAFHIEPLGLGLHYYFTKHDDMPLNAQDNPATANNLCVVTMNDIQGECKFMGFSNKVDCIHSLEFYGGNELAGRNVPTFEEMCQKNDENAMERLGVLRMDVDNLGNIFQSGIPCDHITLSRMAALSRSFDYFFSGYLNTIYKEVEPESSFIIYSGGDDLFIVGSWDVVIKLAKRIRDDFRAYTCHNPAFSISGGIAIVKSKFPIIKGAKNSAEEESRAKAHECKGGNKNSISFISMALNWDEEFGVVEDLKNQLVALIDSAEKQALPKSFLSKVLKHWAMANIHNHKIRNPKTYWVTAYDLTRTIERTNDKEAKELVNRCKNEICGQGHSLNGKTINTDYHMLELWAFACRWAELEIRS